jgi:hypothetical protein
MTIKNNSIMEFYNSDRMKDLRKSFLAGQQPEECQDCYYQDRFDKLSGRRRQLLKSGVTDQFELQLRSSSHYNHFLYSLNNNGVSPHKPTDLQIDLGNTCNSACIMCNPIASSRLAQDYNKLHKIDSVTFAQPNAYHNWQRDSLDKFINELLVIPDIKYIHFLGGETLYDSSFYTICQRLIDSGRSRDIIVGTTTNGTIYDHRVEELIGNFKEFHLGISVESMEPINDYIRYPSQVGTIRSNILKFLKLRESTNLFASLRVTPNIFTAYTLDQLFEFMIEHQITAESCNILYDPACLRIELLPDDIRQEIISKIQMVIRGHGLISTNKLNTRNSSTIPEIISDMVLEYYNFMTSYTVPDDADHHRQQLVRFLKGFETLRKNSILDYAPRYQEFLRTYGY